MVCSDRLLTKAFPAKAGTTTYNAIPAKAGDINIPFKSVELLSDDAFDATLLFVLFLEVRNHGIGGQ